MNTLKKHSLASRLFVALLGFFAMAATASAQTDYSTIQTAATTEATAMVAAGIAIVVAIATVVFGLKGVRALSRLAGSLISSRG